MLLLSPVFSRFWWNWTLIGLLLHFWLLADFKAFSASATVENATKANLQGVVGSVRKQKHFPHWIIEGAGRRLRAYPFDLPFFLGNMMLTAVSKMSLSALSLMVKGRLLTNNVLLGGMGAVRKQTLNKPLVWLRTAGVDMLTDLPFSSVSFLVLLSALTTFRFLCAESTVKT